MFVMICSDCDDLSDCDDVFCMFVMTCYVLMYFVFTCSVCDDVFCL